MGLWWHDLLYAFRVLFKRPGPTFLAILALSLSIGLTTTTFSVLNGFLFKGYPHPEGDRLYEIHAANPERGMARLALPQSALGPLQELTPAIEEATGFYHGTINFSGDERAPVRVDGTYISSNFLRLLREEVALGTPFHELSPAEAAESILIGHEIWTRRYQQSPDIIGHQVRINGQTKKICGVLREGFVFPYYSEVWTVLDPAFSTQQSSEMAIQVVARLADGATPEELPEQLDAIAPELFSGENEYRTTLTSNRFGVLPVFESDGAFWSAVEIAVMVSLLLIACANVANLLLGRAAARGRELAIRAALGANRRRLMAQLLCESFVLAVLGAIGGLLFALWQVDVDPRAISHELPAWLSFQLDARVYGFVAAIIVLVALLAGIIPAFQASRVELNEMLKDGARTASSFRLNRFTKALTIGQIAFCCALLFAAGISMRHLLRLEGHENTFTPEEILTMRLGLFVEDYPDQDARTAFVDQMIERVRGIQGVADAAASSWISEGAMGNFPLAFQILDTASESDPQTATLELAPAEWVTPGYFSTVESDIVSGRAFLPEDRDPEQPEVAVVNEAFRDQFLGSVDDPMDQTLMLGFNQKENPEPRPVAIVGVVENVFPTLPHAFGAGPKPVVYLPLRRDTLAFLTLLVRNNGGNAHALDEPVTAAIQTIDPHLPPYFVRTLEDYFERVLMPYRMIVQLFLFVAFMALFLAAVGVYSLMAFSVSLRRQEFGVRMAVGARRGNLVRMVLRDALTQLGIGIALGLAFAVLLGLAVSRALRAAFNPDASLLLLVFLVLTAATLLALVVPLRRTARLSPMEALRYE